MWLSLLLGNVYDYNYNIMTMTMKMTMIMTIIMIMAMIMIMIMIMMVSFMTGVIWPDLLTILTLYPLKLNLFRDRLDG